MPLYSHRYLARNAQKRFICYIIIRKFSKIIAFPLMLNVLRISITITRDKIRLDLLCDTTFTERL